jgi:primosomal protein N' (replication factor Y)
VASEIKRFFPKARVTRLDRDSAGGGQWLDVLEKMKNREIDVLVGTQMITKGHDYPNLTLVGILDADVGLHLARFPRAERTYQIVTQVSGRAGRADRPGRVLIQTYRPGHESLVAAATHDGLAFSETELGHRREAGYPPFNRLIEIRLSDAQPDRVRKVFETLTAAWNASYPARTAFWAPPPAPSKPSAVGRAGTS